MKIKVISVGKLKEKYLVDAVSEYSKRLSKFCKLELIEVKDEHAPDNISLKDIEKIKDIEGEKILSKIKDNEYIIPLCIEGKQLSSEDLASKINELSTYGNPNLTFIIGGSFGISDNVKKLGKLKLSFSKMTFPHQLMKVFLLEQIFRSFKINNNESYHK